MVPPSGCVQKTQMPSSATMLVASSPLRQSPRPVRASYEGPRPQPMAGSRPSMSTALSTGSSFAYCRRVTWRSGSSFLPCFLLLGRPKRRAMTTLYAFMRHTDDLVDNDRPVDQRRQAIRLWREALSSTLQTGSTSPASSTGGPGPLAAPGQAVLPALGEAVRRFGIPHECLYGVIDGAEMDLDRASYQTFDELAEYCHRVASAVGLACIHIWGFRPDGATELARSCGVAFQLTNILRDLREDACYGRIYLPQEDLRRFGYSVDDLRRAVADDRFRALMAFQVDRARRFYCKGTPLLERLAPDGKRAFGMMVSIYYALLEKIGRRPEEVLRRRVRVGRLRKAAIVARWLLLPVRHTALPHMGQDE